MDNLSGIKRLINSYGEIGLKAGMILVILSTFFLYTTIFTEFFDTPKFLVVSIFTALLLVVWVLKFAFSGKIVFLRTPLDIPLLLLLAVAIVSTVLSPSPYVSALGNQLKIHGSLVSLIIYVVFYFMLVNNLKPAKGIKGIFTIAIIAAQVLAVLSLLGHAGFNMLPESWMKFISFNPTGSAFSTTAILALLVPFIIMQLLSSSKPVSIILNSAFLLISGAAIALQGSWATWIAALFGVIVTLSVINPLKHGIKSLKPFTLMGLVVPLVIITTITILSFIPPVGKAKNPIYEKAQSFPKEIQLGFLPSLKISVSAFRDVPFWGTGPSTYLFDFTAYKPVELNSTKLWNIRFDSSFNEYLQVLATLGGIGLLALLSMTALFISSASSVILSAAKDLKIESGDSSSRTPQNDNHKVALAVSGIAFFIILALHAATLAVWVIGLLIIASFMVSLGLQKRSGEGNFKDTFLRIAAVTPSSNLPEETIKVNALPGVLLVLSIASVLFAFFFGAKLVLADYHHRLALNALSQNQGIIAYNELVVAEKLNPKNDVYRAGLAQTNFALANAIAVAKAPTEASPAGSLTDADKQNIQVLLQQSINEGKIAVALSPKSAINWEVLALLYRQISGVATNGLAFALDSYGRAIMVDPLNPQLRLNVGGVYYASKNYDMAIRFFTDAINLKPDFANGYYNLSVALKDKGDLEGAKTLAEKTLTLVDKSSSDYKTISDYLSNLTSELESKKTPSEPPAAKTTGALQKDQLPKVINLPKPTNIATPEAVKKPQQ